MKQENKKIKQVGIYTEKSEKGYTNYYIVLPNGEKDFVVEIFPKWLNPKQRRFLTYLINKD